MWESGGRYHNITIQDHLRDKSLDLVVMNLGAHIQTKPVSEQLKKYSNFLEKVATFYRENFKVADNQRTMAPLLWNTMNAHLPELKPEAFQYQTTLLSNIYNDLAYFAFGNVSIPIINFNSMIISGLPSTTRDGLHTPKFVDIMKHQMILNYLCNSGDFDSNFLFGEGYNNKVRGF